VTLVDISQDNQVPLRILRKKHTYFGRLEIPFYNEELDMSQGPPHGEAVPVVGAVVTTLRKKTGLSSTCDNPITGINPKNGQEKIYFPDFTLLEGDKDCPDNAIMTDMRLAIEVVTTTTKKSTNHDTKFKKKLYEYNRVPEYLIIFPNETDDRNFLWYALKEDKYVLKKPDKEGFTSSKSVPGFAIKPLSKKKWSQGRKIRYFINGLEIRERLVEHNARIKAEKQTQWAENRALKERTAKEQALAEKEQERIAKEQERAAKEQALTEKEQERAAKEQALAELERLRAQLRQQDGQ
jgi:hypothetical protein